MFKKKTPKVESGSAVLPPFYKSIVPLFSGTHKKLKFCGHTSYSYAAEATALVLLTEEFPAAERDYPIVFSRGPNAVPMALTGIPGGRNQFVSSSGEWKSGVYVPGYVRRYPFILAKASPDDTELTLCFDQESELFSEGEEGSLFVGDQPSELAQTILQLCQAFETGGARTRKFVSELEKLDLLIDAHAKFRKQGAEPSQFDGFQIVSEEKLRKLTDDQMQALSKSGALALIHAHLLSLKNFDRLFTRQWAGEHKHEAGTEGVAAA